MTRPTLAATLTSLASLAAGPALAGGYVAPVVQAPVIAPVEQSAPAPWQGGYLGLTLGYACCGDDDVGIGVGQVRTLTTPDTLELGGMNYGLRAGYRWQRGFGQRQGVFGLELGYERGSIEDEFTTAGYTARDEVQSVLALRAKTGVLNAAQDTLFYGIAGIGRGKFDYKVQGTGAGGAIDVDDSFRHNGYIVGLGLERRLSERVSLTGEWEYANFGKTHLEDAAGKSTEATPDWHNLKLGLNFRF